MNGVNLLPPSRIATWRLRKRISRWSVVLSAYIGLVLCAAPILAPAVSEAARETEQKIQMAEAQFEQADAAHRKLQPELSRALEEIENARAISEHPNWSLLLALAGALRQEDILLESCELSSPTPSSEAPTKQSKPEKAAPPPEPPALGLSGYSLTPAGVTQYALRLERSGLFSAVQIIETSPRELHGTATTGFRMRCVLDTPANTEPSKPAKAGSKR